MEKHLNNLIDGNFCESQDGTRIEVRDPAQPDRIVGSVPAMSSADLESVFTAAEQGAKTWREMGALARGAVLLRAAELIRQRKGDLVETIVAEMGKTRTEATGEVTKTAEFFEYYGGMGRDDFGQFLPDGRPSTFAARFVEPLGVVVLITPWNDPCLTPARKLAPALIAGNAVVIKPATVTPLITLELAGILQESGVPAGALGTVTGRGSAIGDALLEFEAIKAVSFTGSTSVGKRLQAGMAGRRVRVQTEMGGKNAAVIMNDADLEATIPTVVAGAFAQAGQRCTATSRLIVHTEIAAKVRQLIADAVSGLTVAPGTTDGADLGPVVDGGAQKSIEAHVRKAIEQGAELVAQNELVGHAASEGHFVAPTFLDITTSHDIWSEEVFGPVLGMVEVDSFNEAIDLVNDSEYGLSSCIFTRDLGTAFDFVKRVDTGQVSVNQPTTGWDIHHPFGGFKDSGSGFKEQGRDALNFYTRIKAAAIRTR